MRLRSCESEKKVILESMNRWRFSRNQTGAVIGIILRNKPAVLWDSFVVAFLFLWKMISEYAIVGGAVIILHGQERTILKKSANSIMRDVSNPMASRNLGGMFAFLFVLDTPFTFSVCDVLVSFNGSVGICSVGLP